MILLRECLFFPIGERVRAAEGPGAGLTTVQVKDGQGFTRVVFLSDRPEETSLESDPQNARFVIRFPGGGTEIAKPLVPKDHPIIRQIETRPDPEGGLQVHVMLANGSVDWVSYRYDRPPRTVLYLKERADSDTPESRTAVPSVSPESGTKEARKPKPTVEVQKDVRRSEKEPSVDGVKTTHAKEGSSPVKKDKSPPQKDEDGGEELWRPSGEAIPEFVRPGAIYPPDLHQPMESERRLYQQALEAFRNRDFLRAKEVASKIVPKDRFSSLAEILAFFNADCDFRAAEAEGTGLYGDAIQRYREAANRFPKSRFVPNAVLTMATGYRRMEFFQEATIQYEFFLKEFPEHTAVPEALFWKGESLFQSGKYAEEKKSFEDFVPEFPRSIHGRVASLRIGDCLYETGDPEGAHRQYGTVLSDVSTLSHYPIDSLFRAGRSFIETGDSQRGRAILFRALNLDPKSKDAPAMMVHIARSYLDEDRQDEALKVNLVLLKNFGSDQSRLADIGLSHSSDGRGEPARASADFKDSSRDVDLTEIVARFQWLGLDRLLFTKLDEAATFGMILNLVFSTELSLSYLTIGQKVPEDMPEARPKILSHPIFSRMSLKKRGGREGTVGSSRGEN
jgi:TolA-binding protein